MRPRNGKPSDGKTTCTLPPWFTDQMMEEARAWFPHVTFTRAKPPEDAALLAQPWRIHERRED